MPSRQRPPCRGGAVGIIQVWGPCASGLAVTVLASWRPRSMPGRQTLDQRKSFDHYPREMVEPARPPDSAQILNVRNPSAHFRRLPARPVRPQLRRAKSRHRNMPSLFFPAESLPESPLVGAHCETPPPLRAAAVRPGPKSDPKYFMFVTRKKERSFAPPSPPPRSPCGVRRAVTATH